MLPAPGKRPCFILVLSHPCGRGPLRAVTWTPGLGRTWWGRPASQTPLQSSPSERALPLPSRGELATGRTSSSATISRCAVCAAICLMKAPGCRGPQPRAGHGPGSGRVTAVQEGRFCDLTRHRERKRTGKYCG